MKLGRIVDPAFHEVLNKLISQTLPLKAAFKVKGISRQVREEYNKYEEVRAAALNTHGLKNDDGTLQLNPENNTVKFDNEGISAFAKEMSDLTSMDVNIDNVKLSELGDKVVLSVSDLEVLDGVVVGD